MRKTQAEQFRELAEELRSCADNICDPNAADALREAAYRYERRAEDLEKEAAKQKKP